MKTWPRPDLPSDYCAASVQIWDLDNNPTTLWGSGAGGSSYSSDLSHHPEIRMLHSGFMLFVPGPRDCVKREARPIILSFIVQQ